MPDEQLTDTLDLSGYRDTFGERVPPGRYRVQVVDAKITTASSGNKMYQVWLDVVDGEYAGATLVDRLVNTSNSLFRVVGFLQAIGHPTPKKKFTVEPRTWKGKVLDVDVEDGEPWQGRVRSEVRGYLKVEGARQRQTDLGDLGEFDSNGQAAFADTGDGADEFAAETTRNPSPEVEAERLRQRVDQPSGEGAINIEDVDL